ncbi:DnaB-like helicase C-terminal domain-containing protein [Pectobacterium carotovorum]|uniref:replicative DNA helicase n=1 Tax=Pectobacterium carotovorum TaxID=554 RepID=UPI0029D4CC76|nr:DnaB-like helicase C-terminal domain-containing protein [Pectobacterium carotovorum]MDX6916530.1 DnaB-like helicase C-terminal domain-containing protein [Pectobacterium carotovorum]
MTSFWRNYDIESAFIGCLFLRGLDSEVLEIINRVPEGAFASLQLREIYRGVRQQAKTTGVIDPVLLSDAMPTYSAIIIETGRSAQGTAMLKPYADSLLRNAAIREAEDALSNAQKIIGGARTPEEAVRAVNDAKGVIAALSFNSGTISPIHIDELLPRVVDRLDAKMAGESDGRSLLTGIEDLDLLTGGFDPTDLIFIAARPSMGKTESVLDITDSVSAKGGGVLLFSMEMSDDQITDRMVSAAGGLPVSKLRAPEHLDDESWARISRGIGQMTGRPIWIIDASELTVTEIESISAAHKIAHPETVLVIVDYLGLIKTEGSKRYDLEIGDVSKGLKRIAKTQRTPVIALSQLSRSVESRVNKRPVNADMKNSGEIEADADVIMMLYRDEVYNPDSPAKGVAEINITKNRNGPLGTVYRRFFNGHFFPINQDEAKKLSTPEVQQAGRSRPYKKSYRNGSDNAY